MNMIAHGILFWCSTERRSRRYGSITLDAVSFDESDRTTVTLDGDALAALVGKQVRIVATVTETRDSPHEGDPFIGMKPSRPKLGEVIEIGVGILRIEPCEWSPIHLSIVLEPSDGRQEAWIDPRILYRLHDQTVSLSVEESDAPDTPRTPLVFKPPGVISDGADGVCASGEGFATAEQIHIAPTFTRIGEGTYLIERPQVPAGEYLPATPVPPKT